MKTSKQSLLRVAGRGALCAGLAAVSLSSCVVRERGVVHRGPHPLYVREERVVTVLPGHAHVVTVRGERCWLHNGTYYRRHAHGYVVFVP